MKTVESGVQDASQYDEADIKSENISTHSRNIILARHTKNRIQFQNTITARNHNLPAINTNESIAHNKEDQSNPLFNKRINMNDVGINKNDELGE